MIAVEKFVTTLRSMNGVDSTKVLESDLAFETTKIQKNKKELE